MSYMLGEQGPERLRHLDAALGSLGLALADPDLPRVHVPAAEPDDLGGAESKVQGRERGQRSGAVVLRPSRAPGVPARCPIERDAKPAVRLGYVELLLATLAAPERLDGIEHAW